MTARAGKRGLPFWSPAKSFTHRRYCTHQRHLRDRTPFYAASLSPARFFIHDYETFGTRPALDRPAQFAAIRTDEAFNVIGEPEVFYCKPADDYLPQPEAVMVTGITPQEALAKGDSEAAFARRIHDLFTLPKTCVVGYNNVRFDDEVTRNIFLS
jgi:Exodeoxyribonuclease I subunit C (EC 3.1.11.1)